MNCKSIHAYLSSLFILFSLSVQADEIEIEYANTNLLPDALYLDAQINYAFHDDVIKALRHGVDLNIDIDILIKEERKWLWDKVIKHGVLKFKLEHHPLTDIYIVTHLSNYERVQFDDLDVALNYLGNINNYLLLDASIIDADKIYSGQLTARLNIEDLPAPLRTIAYMSSRWQVDSRPYFWDFD